MKDNQTAKNSSSNKSFSSYDYKKLKENKIFNSEIYLEKSKKELSLSK